jgi:hypothetical protein
MKLETFIKAAPKVANLRIKDVRSDVYIGTVSGFMGSIEEKNYGKWTVNSCNYYPNQMLYIISIMEG